MTCTARIGLAEFCVIVVRWNRYAVLIEFVSDVVRTDTACAHFKNATDDRCGIGINHRQMIRIIAFRIPERSAGCAILACLCIGFDDSLDLLTRRSSVPLIE